MIKVERSFPAPASLAEEAKKSNGKYGRLVQYCLNNNE